jgi:hypothetical protein
MSRRKNVLIFLLVVIAVLVLAYLLRNVPVPPDCRTQPDNPACREAQ